MEIFSIQSLELDAQLLAAKLRVDGQIIERLAESVIHVSKAKAAFRVCYLGEKRKDAVVVGSVRFSSRVMARNLSDVGKVVPYVLTLGAKFDALVDDTEDILEKYLLDEIGNVALRESRRKLESHLLKKFAFEKISCMSPGSLADWPIEEQKKLFSLLEGVESAIRVRLTDHYLMVPRKSVSGIYFPSEVTFHSCQLCPRKRCESRKARFDETKAREYGIPGSTD